MRTKCASAIIALIVTTSVAVGQDIVGQATVIDGDTIEIHGQRIRLWGIDAPESDQLCRGSDSQPFRCGAAAALALSDKIGPRAVTCSPRDVDRYRRVVAVCSAAGEDMAQWLVRSGHALDWPRYSQGVYEKEQAAAERAESGVWAGSFAKPWKYRACRRMGTAINQCSDGD